MTKLHKFLNVSRIGASLLLLGIASLSQAQFASSTQPELNSKAAGGYSASGKAAVPWMDSTMAGGTAGPSPTAANCPAGSRWGMRYGGSIVACLFPDQRCDGDEKPVTVSWRQYSTRTQYEPQGCCARETRTYTYDVNCRTTTDINGNTSTTCDQATGTYTVAKLQGCNVTKQFYSDCTGTVRHKWSKIYYRSRALSSPSTCMGRDAAGRPTAYVGTVCYDEVRRDTIQSPPTIQSSTNSTGGGVGTAAFSCMGNDQWSEYPSPENNVCPLGSYNWNQGEFVRRDGPWNC